jgi:predicted XRE-type DNA-binding protein
MTLVDRPGDDAVLLALDELLVVARANIVSWVGVMERIEQIRSSRREGVRYRDMELDEGSRPVIATVSDNQERLSAVAAQFRRALAEQLHAEGMSSADIARAFGVSRQRISNLLKGEREDAPGNGD